MYDEAIKDHQDYEAEILKAKSKSSKTPQKASWLELELKELGKTKSRLASDTGVNSNTINKILAGEDVAASSIAKIERKLKGYRISQSKRLNNAAKSSGVSTEVETSVVS
jgi:transcriptional regulator with XRE-family HTH domain